MIPPNDNRAPNEKKLRFASFAVHATRGLVRDQNARRKTMFLAVLVAALLLFCGSTFLAPVLDPHARPGWFIFFWFVCAWITVLATLLAVFDLLLVRAEGRAARRRLKDVFSKSTDPDEEA